MATEKKALHLTVRILMFIVSVLLIVLACPKEAKFQYQYELGKPWQYNLLTADFDIPIYKDRSEIRAEREEILDNKILYYDYTTTSYRTALKYMESDVMKLVEEVKQEQTKSQEAQLFIRNYNDYIEYLQKELKYIYDCGLVSDGDWFDIKEGKSDHIIVLDGNNLGKPRSKNTVLSVSRSKSMITSPSSIPDKVSEAYLDKLKLDHYLIPNLTFNQEITDKLLTEEYKKVSATQGMVQRGERIIDKGEIVSEQKVKILNSLKQELSSQSEGNTHQRLRTIMGQIGIICCLVGFFFIYSFIFRRKYFDSNRYFSLTLLLITLFASATSLIVQFAEPDLVYIIPYALVPMIISTFYDTRTALFIHITVILLASFFVAVPLEFILLQLPVGMMAIYTSKDLSERSQLIRSALFIIATYCFFYLNYGLVLDGDFIVADKMMFLWFGINGVLLLFAYPMIFLIEKLFGYTSNVTLLELSNTNNKVLKELSENAPGTFQHSLQVSNLAADIASRLNANSLMAKTGALYHDIGKIKDPVFFTENQHGGTNPHDRLKPEESASVIIRHVKDGLEMAKENNLPQCILDIIETHHGSTKTKYFYNTWLNNNPGKEIDESKFTYNGRNPFTLEQAIIMICDAIEAASRSLPEYTDESINKLVDNIVDGIVSSHYLDNTPLKMNQIVIIKDILKEKLKNIYHTRIAYPEVVKN